MTIQDVRAVLFDLDDTITDFASAADAAFIAAFSDVCEEHGIDVNELHARYMELFEEYYTLHLEGEITLEEFRAYRFSRAFEMVGLPVDDDFLDLTVDFLYYYDLELETFPGACEVLRALDKVYPLGLITNGPTDPQWEKINKFNLSAIFEVILVSGQLGIAKPDPRIFDVALEGLRVAPEEAIMVGNSLVHDHQGAINAGIRFVWANHTGKPLPDGWPEPDYVVGTFYELRDLLM